MTLSRNNLGRLQKVDLRGTRALWQTSIDSDYEIGHRERSHQSRDRRSGRGTTTPLAHTIIYI